jgi:hypothetical protein
MAFRDLTIWITSGGSPTTAAIKWEVLYGGRWTGGAPFAAGSTHVGGVHKDNDVIAGPAEVAEVIYQDTNAFPASAPRALPPGQTWHAGFPIVVEIDNTAGMVPVSANVVFLSRENSDSQV